MKTNQLVINDAYNKKTLHIVELIVILFFSSYYLLPSIGNMFSPLSITFLGLAYCAYVLLVQPKESKFIILFIFLAILISLMYYLLTETRTINANVSNYDLKRFMSKFFQYFLMFFPAVLMLRFITNANDKQKKLTLILLSIMLIYVMFVTMRELEINPDITRSWDDNIETASENVAGYYFVYAIPIVVSVLVMLIIKAKNFLQKTALIFFIVFCFFFLLQAQYTLSILIAMIGIILGFLKSSKNNAAKIIISVTVIILMFFLADILRSIAINVKSAQVSLRFHELANFFSSGDASGYNLDGRLTLYWKTIKAFFASPLIGNSRLDFDGHTTFLTVLSDTGILGGIPFYILYFSTKNKVVNLLEDKNNLFAIPFLMLVIMGLTNPIHAAYPVGFAVWFICPLVIDVISNKEKYQEVITNGKLEN